MFEQIKKETEMKKKKKCSDRLEWGDNREWIKEEEMKKTELRQSIKKKKRNLTVCLSLFHSKMFKD